jgi:hypothetical protein
MSEAGSVRRRRRSRVEVEKLVAEYEASGLTRDAFCQQRGLSVAALDKYRRRVQKWARSGAGPMLPVEVVLSRAQGGALGRTAWIRKLIYATCSLAIVDTYGPSPQNPLFVQTARNGHLPWCGRRDATMRAKRRHQRKLTTNQSRGK